MSKKTKIQWCDSTVNPIMGCGGCELYPSPVKILAALDQIFKHYGWPEGRAEEIYRNLIKKAYAAIRVPLLGHSRSMSTTNLWHLRKEFFVVVSGDLGQAAAAEGEVEIRKLIKCYAAILHLNKARSIFAPERGANKGYAPVFEQVTQFDGRVYDATSWRDLSGNIRPGKPWLAGCPRLIFVSDMGDAFLRDSDFSFLEDEVIEPIRSEKGQRHFWLWLTKRPDRMARFRERIGGFPKNVCAMTTLTGPDKLSRIDQLREVPAAVHGLSVEPLWERIPPKMLNLKGIDWMIAGGESGRKDAVRPFHLEWARDLRDLCKKKKVAFFLKQLGRRPVESGNELKLKDSHGGDWSEWPQDLRVREMPVAFRAWR